jgi:hypothetical protein
METVLIIESRAKNELASPRLHEGEVRDKTVYMPAYPTGHSLPKDRLFKGEVIRRRVNNEGIWFVVTYELYDEKEHGKQLLEDFKDGKAFKVDS